MTNEEVERSVAVTFDRLSDEAHNLVHLMHRNSKMIDELVRSTQAAFCRGQQIVLEMRALEEFSLLGGTPKWEA